MLKHIYFLSIKDSTCRKFRQIRLKGNSKTTEEKQLMHKKYKSPVINP